MKHLSSIANNVINQCAEKLDITPSALINEFEAIWKEETGPYSRKLVEFCTSKVLVEECRLIGERINDGSFSRFTFDVMLAWETPTLQEEEARIECEGKQTEDRKSHSSQDDIPLFYSDIMPLLVNNEPAVREDAFVWFGSIVPLAIDVANGRFTFEALTATTNYRLFYPAYDKFLKEIHERIKHLQKQVKPKGVELGDDEFILHVDGTARTQRVVRHIGSTSWPGKLTLTNYAVYFEASGVITYEDAIKIDLSKDIAHSVKAAATGPWGAPLFDKAIAYESPELTEEIIVEFPEVTSSTRRDHWLSLIKEVILMHRFISNNAEFNPVEIWEIHARTILGIVRLHAAREMVRISLPPPTRFLLFALFAEVPKGDYVLKELAETIKRGPSLVSCTASSLLMTLNAVHPVPSLCPSPPVLRTYSALEGAVQQAKLESTQTEHAKLTSESLKDEGISESFSIFWELVKPVRTAVPWFQDIVNWRKPASTTAFMAATLFIIFKEWLGKALAGLLIWAAWRILRAKLGKTTPAGDEIVVRTCTDKKSTVESIVSAQHGLITVHKLLQDTNISLLKIWSLLSYKAPKQSEMAVVAVLAAALVLLAVPFKFLLMALEIQTFASTSPLGRYITSEDGNRRLKEWWDSIPVVNIRIQQ